MRRHQIYRSGSGEFDTYSALAVQHFMNPQNVGYLEGADGRGCTTSDSIEDFVEVSIRVDEETQRILSIRFRAVGCPAVMASSSMLTELARGRHISEALSIVPEQIETSLGGLPESKRHCADLPLRALRAAVEDYEQRLNLKMLRRGQPTASFSPSL